MNPLSPHHPAIPRARAKSRPLYHIALASAALVIAPLLGISCAPPKDRGSCVGGVIVDGVCEGTCTPDKCLDQNTCVGNRCVLVCQSHADCYPDGVQSCAPATEDHTGASILVCQPSGEPGGIGAACPQGPECDAFLSCPDGAGCKADQCGGMPDACVLDEEACKGEEGCTAGKCPDGEACRVGCVKDCKPWLACETAGEGDPTAYCTVRDCASDADCLTGYYCGISRAHDDVCGPTCAGADPDKKCSGGLKDGQSCADDRDCQKGNDSLCGTTTGPCKTPGEGGTTLFEGSQCMLRRSCLKRGPGVACETDLDCTRTEGQKCAALAGVRACAQGCTSDFDCLSDSACDLDQGVCLPRFGAWIGTGKFCEPCLSDEDCGKNGSTSACAVLTGAGRACFDYGYPDVCSTDADCPASPSGLRAICLDEADGLSPADSLYHRCTFPIDPDNLKPTCW